MDGFSDRKLEALSKSARFEKGLSPWATWESERTGFGLGFRKAGSYPPFLPLFFSSDHYADPITELRPNEVNPAYGVHLTWNPVKVEKLRSLGVDSHLVQHPWRYLGLKTTPAPPNKSTLLFLPHSHDRLRVELDWGPLQESLEEKGLAAGRVAICLGSFDIQRGFHKEVRERLKLPIVTAGDTTSQLFPYRLWKLISGFAFTAGLSPGSQMYYAVMASRQYHLFGEDLGVFFVEAEDERWEIASLERRMNRAFPDPETRRRLEGFLVSLRIRKPFPSPYEVEFVSDTLFPRGALSRPELRKIMYRQLRLNLGELSALWRLERTLPTS